MNALDSPISKQPHVHLNKVNLCSWLGANDSNRPIVYRIMTYEHAPSCIINLDIRMGALELI